MSAAARRAVALLACALVLGSAGCTTPEPSPAPAPAPAPGTSQAGSPGTSGPAPAPAATSPLRVVDAWVSRVGGDQARIYFTLMNPGFSAVDVIAVRTDAGGAAHLRETPAASEAAAAIMVEAGQSVRFSEQGPFIAVEGLPQPLQPGDRVVVTLTTRGGEITRFSAFAHTAPPGH